MRADVWHMVELILAGAAILGLAAGGRYLVSVVTGRGASGSTSSATAEGVSTHVSVGSPAPGSVALCSEAVHRSLERVSDAQAQIALVLARQTTLLELLHRRSPPAGGDS